MSTRPNFLFPLLATSGVCALLSTSMLMADGPGAHRPRERPAAAVMEAPVQGASADAYNAGYAAIQRADHHVDLAGAAANDAERAAAKKSAEKEYAAAVTHFKAAVRHDAKIPDAYTYLGYAQRKLGRYEEALQAYDQALQLNPDSVHAIEYQGEAFLGLNRIDEARFNYLRLYALDQQQAVKLVHAMRTWLDTHAKDRGGLEPAAYEQFKQWVEARPTTAAPSTKKSGW